MENNEHKQEERVDAPRGSSVESPVDDIELTKPVENQNDHPVPNKVTAKDIFDSEICSNSPSALLAKALWQTAYDLGWRVDGITKTVKGDTSGGTPTARMVISLSVEPA